MMIIIDEVMKSLAPVLYILVQYSNQQNKLHNIYVLVLISLSLIANFSPIGVETRVEISL